MNHAQILRTALDVKLAEAREQFGLQFSALELDLGLRGLTAGRGGYSIARDAVIIRLNLEAFEQGHEHIMVNTIPHEVAHAVVERERQRSEVTRRGRYAAHGAYWRRVCLALGGNGQSRHSLPLKRARARIEHVYELPRAGTVIAGPKQHAAIMCGARYRMRTTGEVMTPETYTGKRIVRE